MAERREQREYAEQRGAQWQSACYSVEDMLQARYAPPRYGGGGAMVYVW